MLYCEFDKEIRHNIEKNYLKQDWLLCQFIFINLRIVLNLNVVFIFLLLFFIRNLKAQLIKLSKHLLPLLWSQGKLFISEETRVQETLNSIFVHPVTNEDQLLSPVLIFIFCSILLHHVSLDQLHVAGLPEIRLQTHPSHLRSNAENIACLLPASYSVMSCGDPQKSFASQQVSELSLTSLVLLVRFLLHFLQLQLLLFIHQLLCLLINFWFLLLILLIFRHPRILAIFIIEIFNRIHEVRVEELLHQFAGMKWFLLKNSMMKMARIL